MAVNGASSLMVTVWLWWNAG